MPQRSTFARLLLRKVESEKYSALSPDDDNDSETSTLDVAQQSHGRKFLVILPWILAGIFGSISIVLLTMIICSSAWSRSDLINSKGSQWGTFGTGFMTEFGTLCFTFPDEFLQLTMYCFLSGCEEAHISGRDKVRIWSRGQRKWKND
jgi:hypothetical protein